MVRVKVSSLALAVVLAGCAGPAVVVPPDQVQAARQSGSLANLYSQQKQKLAPLNPKSQGYLTGKAQLDDIGRQLADTLEQSLQQELAQNTGAAGLTPLPVVQSVTQRLAPMQEWDSARYQKLQTDFNERLAKTQTRIQELQASIGRLGDSEMAKRMTLLDDLTKLTGDNRYQQERQDVLANLRRRAEDALKNEQYGEAKAALQALQQVTPEDKSVGQQLLQADAKLFEKKFWDALGEGKLDEAYTQFTSLAATPEFGEVIKRVNRSTDDMVAYFIAQADVASNEGDVGKAYRYFSQAIDIRNKVHTDTSETPPQVTAFLDRIREHADKAQKAGQIGVALGSLKVLEEFGGTSSALRPQLRATNDAILSRAMRKVSTAAFVTPTGDSEFGGAVAARVTQFLFEKIPNDIRIIERDQFQAILREKELSSGKGNTPSVLSTADYLIQGKLESRVDTTEKQHKKTMRVVTEKMTVANPDYAQWLQLPEASRKNVTEPPRTVPQDRREDITVNYTLVRKVGIISASYRLIEANTGKVAYTDSYTAKEEHSDEGNDGIELGDFRLAASLPNLPSDNEILNQLVDKISTTIGDKLVQKLANQEVGYVQLAERYADENDYANAAEQMANAYSIAQEKQQESTNMLKNLKRYAMQAKL